MRSYPWSPSIVKTLTAKGADPNNLNEWHSTTVLHLAAGAGHRDIVETLLANGADPKLRDRNGRKTCQRTRAGIIKEAIQNFMSVPHSLQFYCRASIRSRLIKCRPDNGLTIKEVAGNCRCRHRWRSMYIARCHCRASPGCIISTVSVVFLMVSTNGINSRFAVIRRACKGGTTSARSPVRWITVLGQTANRQILSRLIAEPSSKGQDDNTNSVF